ncbi:MAG: hypothetical protein NVSMB6_21460 [Burkholderiaceae bacterium]
MSGFYYDLVTDRIKLMPAKNIEVIRDPDGSPRDAADVVKAYVESLPSWKVTAANLPVNRIRLTKPLPKPEHGIREMQPLGCAAQ